MKDLLRNWLWSFLELDKAFADLRREITEEIDEQISPLAHDIINVEDAVGRVENTVDDLESTVDALERDIENEKG